MRVRLNSILLSSAICNLRLLFATRCEAFQPRISSSSTSTTTSTWRRIGSSDSNGHSSPVIQNSSRTDQVETSFTLNSPTPITTAEPEPQTKPILDELDLLDPQTISQNVFQNDKRPIILFDGVCNLCNNAVNLALDWDPNAKLRFSALQSNVGRALLQQNGREADDISSIVLVTQDGAFIKSDAILKITEELTPLYSLLPLKPAAVLGRYIVPKFLRDIIYDGVADNRYSLMGKKNECRFDADGEYESRFIDDSLAFRSSCSGSV